MNISINRREFVVIRQALARALLRNINQRKRAKRNLACLAMEGADIQMLYDKFKAMDP
jgi:hypothetical protein